jgi:predicted Zn-dependent protease
MKNLAYKFLVCLSVAISACANNPGSVHRSDNKEGFPAEKIELRDKVHAYVVKTFGIYPDPGLNTYVAGVAARMSRNLPYQFKFYVLDTPRVQAWAVPGGNIYITRGLLAAIRTEDQLAAVIGHELAHIMFNHSDRFRDAAKSTYELGRAIHSHTSYQHVKQLAAEFSLAVNQGYSREQEYEADRMGLRYMKSAGYDPAAAQGLLKLFLARERQDHIDADALGLEQSNPFELYSSHPATGKRLEAVTRLMGNRTAKGTFQDASQQRYLSKIDGIIYGDAAPFVKIQRRRLLFKKPSIKLNIGKGWVALHEDRKLVLFRPDKKWVQLILNDKIKPGRTPRETFVKNIFHVSKNRGRTLRIAGINAYTADVTRDRGDKKVRARITLLSRGADAIVMVGTTLDRKLPPSLDRELRRMASRARPLKHPDRIDFEPMRIRVVRARAGDTFASLARKIPVYYHAEAQLRLLNNAGPNDRLQPGQLLKLIQ